MCFTLYFCPSHTFNSFFVKKPTPPKHTVLKAVCKAHSEIILLDIIWLDIIWLVQV